MDSLFSITGGTRRFHSIFFFLPSFCYHDEQRPRCLPICLILHTHTNTFTLAPSVPSQHMRGAGERRRMVLGVGYILFPIPSHPIPVCVFRFHPSIHPPIYSSSSSTSQPVEKKRQPTISPSFHPSIHITIHSCCCYHRSSLLFLLFQKAMGPFPSFPPVRHRHCPFFS